MADPLFDQLSAVTLSDMQRDVLVDNFFVDGAWQRLTRYYAAERPFTGGLFMQIPFQYDRVNGGAYTPGADVQVVEKQIIGAMGFMPKAYKEDIALNLFQLGVINNGPAAAVSIYDAYYENATSAMSTDLNIDAYQHGQPNSSTVLQNRTPFMDGMDEACNDGVNPGFMGNVYPLYGGNTRNGVVGNTLNSVPLWAGDQNGNPGQVTYSLLFGAYLNCVRPPDTGLCNKACFQYIGARNEPKQIFAQETDVRIGLTGFKIMEAYIHVDKLAPSTKYGQLLPAGLSMTTGVQPPTSFTTSALTATQKAISNYPASTACKPGEPFWWLRMQEWQIRPTDDPEYNHNFTPLIRSQSNPDLVVAFYKLALNYYTESPRDNVEIVGIGY
jgi:hypothetical protein